MEGILLIDSDVFILLSAAGLLNKAAELIGFRAGSLRRLPALPVQLERGKKFIKNYPQAIRKRVIEKCREIAPLTERPADDVLLDRLARIDNIDDGEAVMFGLMAEQPVYYLASNDKRAMVALALAAEIPDIRDAIKGRVICLETVLRMLVQANGVEATAIAFNPVRDCSTTLRVVFSEMGSTDQSQCLEAVDSYLNDLKKKVGDGFLYEP